MRELKDTVGQCFGDDLIDVVVMGEQLTESCVELSAENYVFVKCSDYFAHIPHLKACKAVYGVLESYDSPSFIPEEQVLEFNKVVTDKHSPFSLKVGDVVRVRKGHFANLLGLVVQVLPGQLYVVLFKLFTKVVTEKMRRNNLKYEKSIFDEVKFPVVQTTKRNRKGKLCATRSVVAPQAMEAYLRTLDEDKVRR
jgi:transcription antitermination factor NusG